MVSGGNHISIENKQRRKRINKEARKCCYCPVHGGSDNFDGQKRDPKNSKKKMISRDTIRKMQLAEAAREREYEQQHG